jgi:pilus assembly protein TadC
VTAGALLALAAALLVWSPGRAVAAARARALSVPAAGRPPPDGPGTPARRWGLAATAGAAAGVLVGGAAGLVVAGAATVAAERLLRRRARSPADDGAALLADLPVGCDLLAACLGSGLPVPGAVAAVARALPAPLGDRLATVANAYRLGAAPRTAWADVPPELAVLGRTLVRGGDSGSAVVPALRGLAADARAAQRSAAEERVRRAGVWLLAPLGACFLPAFVCLGVAPLVLGIAADVFP